MKTVSPWWPKGDGYVLSSTPSSMIAIMNIVFIRTITRLADHHRVLRVQHIHIHRSIRKNVFAYLTEGYDVEEHHVGNAVVFVRHNASLHGRAVSDGFVRVDATSGLFPVVEVPEKLLDLFQRKQTSLLYFFCCCRLSLLIWMYVVVVLCCVYSVVLRCCLFAIAFLYLYFCCYCCCSCRCLLLLLLLFVSILVIGGCGDGASTAYVMFHKNGYQSVTHNIIVMLWW